MKRKVLSLAMCLLMLVSPLSSFADETQETTTAGSMSCTVIANIQDSTSYTVVLPKNISVGQLESGDDLDVDYNVEVSGYIRDYWVVAVSPDESFELSNGTDTVECTVTQSKCLWGNNELDGSFDALGHISATDLSSGSYEGTFNFTISLVTGGFYDSLGRLIKACDYNVETGNTTGWDFTQDGGIYFDYEGDLPSDNILCAMDNLPEGTSTIVVPDGTPRIGNYMFFEIVNVNIIIPDSVTEIGEHAFEHCVNLCLNVPSTVTSIGDSAFKNVELVNYEGYTGSETWGARAMNGVVDDSGFVFANSEKTTLVGYRGSNPVVVIPDSVDIVSDFAFAFNKVVRDVTFPDTLTDMGGAVFCFSRNLEKVVLPSNVTALKAARFGYGNYQQGFFDCCSSLKDVTLPTSLTTLGYRAFGGCLSLDTIELPDSLSSMDTHVFSSTGLKSIDLSNTSLDEIEQNVFSYCSSLESIMLADSITRIDYYSFMRCNSLREVYLGLNTWSIDRSAFNSCTGPIKVYGYKNISDSPWGATNLEYIRLDQQ